MPTSQGFPTPADSTRLALVYNQMRDLATSLDAYLYETVDLTISDATNFEWVPDEPGGVRRIGRSARLVGALRVKNATWVSTSWRTFTMLPLALRPAQQRYGVIYASDARAYGIAVLPNGSVLVRALTGNPAAGTLNTFYLDLMWEVTPA